MTLVRDHRARGIVAQALAVLKIPAGLLICRLALVREGKYGREAEGYLCLLALRRQV